MPFEYSLDIESRQGNLNTKKIDITKTLMVLLRNCEKSSMTQTLQEKLEEKRGPLKGLYLYLLKTPNLIEKFANLGEELRFNSSLPKHILKTVILETAKRHGCLSVWKTHIYPGYKPAWINRAAFSETHRIEIVMTEKFYEMLIGATFAFDIEQPSPRELFVETYQTDTHDQLDSGAQGES